MATGLSAGHRFWSHVLETEGATAENLEMNRARLFAACSVAVHAKLRLTTVNPEHMGTSLAPLAGSHHHITARSNI